MESGDMPQAGTDVLGVLRAPGVSRFRGEFPALLAHFKTSVAGITIVNSFHFFDRIKKTDDEGRAKGFPRSDGSAAEFLDQANITALVTPGLIDHRRVERPSREPGTFAAGFRIAAVIGAQ